MPERPLLVLPPPTMGRRPLGNPPRESLQIPSISRQTERLGPRFDRLSRALESPAELVALQSDPNSIAPDRAIVFEIASALTDFYAAVARMPGLELLAEEERMMTPDDDFSALGRRGEVRSATFLGRLFFAMPDVEALRQIVRLWTLFKEDRPLPRGFGRWKQVFAHLRDVRPWGPQDRVSEESMSYWRERLAEAPNKSIRTEFELWFRDGDPARRSVRNKVAGQITQAGGRILYESEIEEI